jgi:phenylpropionate dioxygenase-like ring-hydroxylating dioxygenase large terminal subunit
MSIDPAAYSDPSAFEGELRGIFSDRFYVGTTADFPDIDCYRSFVVGSKVITVRRTIDGLRAFGNVCLHRSNVIDPLGDGRKQFRCGFHGWNYDKGGRLIGTPFTDIACVAKTTLRVYPVAEVSGLVFVGLSGAAPDVEKVPSAFAKLGMTIAPPFRKESIVHECNWKLLVENILESYHLNFVHRGTFLKSGFTSTSTHEWESDGYVNTASIVPTAETSKLNTIRRLARNATHSYRHAYIAPNLFMSVTNDLIGFISHIYPLSPTRTLLNWELFELPSMMALAEAVRDHMRQEAAEFAATTLAEDKAMVESCQIGISSDTPSVQLQGIEDRVAQFHSYYHERASYA